MKTYPVSYYKFHKWLREQAPADLEFLSFREDNVIVLFLKHNKYTLRKARILVASNTLQIDKQYSRTYALPTWLRLYLTICVMYKKQRGRQYHYIKRRKALELLEHIPDFLKG